MKPVVSAMNAWSCVVVSVFAMVILSVIGSLFRNKHHSLVGSTEDIELGDNEDNIQAVAGSIFTAVIVYAGFFVFCGFQALLHFRQSKRGAIALN